MDYWAPTCELRFVRRTKVLAKAALIPGDPLESNIIATETILQQKWLLADPVLVEAPIRYEWRDVPMAAEDDNI